MNQLVIRGATVVDGLGNEPVRADVAVRDGRIRAVGDVREKGEREIDAEGLTLPLPRASSICTPTTTRRLPGIGPSRRLLRSG